MRAVGEHINLIKPQREKVHRERLRLFMRKGGWISIRKWKIVHGLQFELTLMIIRKMAKITVDDSEITVVKVRSC